VADGVGAAVLSKLVVAASIEAGSLIDLDFALPKRWFFALHHKDRSITQAEREVFRLVETLTKSAVRRAAPASRNKRH
jgi:hypothetical protein